METYVVLREMDKTYTKDPRRLEWIGEFEAATPTEAAFIAAEQRKAGGDYFVLSADAYLALQVRRSTKAVYETVEPTVKP